MPRITSGKLTILFLRDFVYKEFLFTSKNLINNAHIKFAEEFIIWNSDAFKLITLNDKVVTGSSIMPQKKISDTLEYLRGKVGQSYGNLFSMMTILKGLVPYHTLKIFKMTKNLFLKHLIQ